MMVVNLGVREAPYSNRNVEFEQVRLPAVLFRMAQTA